MNKYQKYSILVQVVATGLFGGIAAYVYHLSDKFDWYSAMVGGAVVLMIDTVGKLWDLATPKEGR